MEDKYQTNFEKPTSHQYKQSLKLCNVCGEIRNTSRHDKNYERKKSNGKEETNKET